ncbi:MAG: hypothetical protein UY47_C0002G0026 [Parcubacteria group bacterium GW2011_GWB1_49_7]|nr:MAG: hypothetical protein UX71_C0004G0024 [Parcubacteria group bacterium GW2011_GWA1_47_10]KKW10018.1 MAG: hypothetical protein UY47_C0002G0026 [Parcubacteria group bacterium GW2011_GWB1_49_7]
MREGVWYNFTMKIISTGRTLFSPENYERKKKEKKRKVLAWSAGVLAVFIALVIISRLERLQIREVAAEGAKVVPEEEIARVVKETLSDRYLWLVPWTNAAIYPRRAVRENLMKEFPRISSVSLSLDGMKRLAVSVSERDPYALYCPELARGELVESVDKCFFLDKSGFIFDEAPDFSGVVYFIYKKDAPIKNPKGSQFLLLENFSPLAQFVEGLSKFGFEPVTLTIKDRDVELVTRNGTLILFNAYGDLTFLYSNLEAFLKNPAIEMDKLSELDLRIENKIFWKLFGNN